jgi:hypothetical protein
VQHTISGVAGKFPVGTTLSVYPFVQQAPRNEGPPTGAHVVTTGVVQSDGSVSFTPLAYNTRYWAVGVVSGAYLWVGFRTDAEPTDPPINARLALNLKDFGATGDGATIEDSYLADALEEAGDIGARLIIPRGHYIFEAPFQNPRGVHVQGEGKFATLLDFPDDLGAGVYAVEEGSPTGSQAAAWSMRDLWIRGPGSRSLGVQTCDMDGVAPSGNVDLTDVYVSSFRAGLALVSDHNTFTRVKVADCFYNVLLPSSRTSQGNHTFVTCVLDGATFACVAVEGNNILDEALFLGGHVGFAPYGFYKFDGASASTEGLMSQTSLINLSFEAIGNAAILDESTGSGSGQDTLHHSTIDNPGFSWSGTYKIAARVKDYAVNVRNVNYLRYRGGSNPFSAGTVAAWKIGSNAGSILDDVGSTVTSLIAPTQSATDVRVQNVNYVADVQIASGTIAVGDILEWEGSYNTVRRYQGNRFAGVALSAATVGQKVLFAISGDVSVTSLAIAAVGVEMTADTATTYRAAPVSETVVNPYAPIFGVALDPGGSAGGALCKMRIGLRQNPRVNKPLAVTSLPTASSTYRGHMLRVEGGGGVADVLYVCQKKADNTYAWMAVTVT